MPSPYVNSILNAGRSGQIFQPIVDFKVPAREVAERLGEPLRTVEPVVDALATWELRSYLDIGERTSDETAREYDDDRTLRRMIRSATERLEREYELALVEQTVEDLFTPAVCYRLRRCPALALVKVEGIEDGAATTLTLSDFTLQTGRSSWVFVDAAPAYDAVRITYTAGYTTAVVASGAGTDAVAMTLTTTALSPSLEGCPLSHASWSGHIDTITSTTVLVLSAAQTWADADAVTIYDIPQTPRMALLALVYEMFFLKGTVAVGRSVSALPGSYREIMGDF